MKATVRFVEAQNIIDFVRDMNTFVSDINAGCGRSLVDAKSRMGMFTLSCPHPIEIEILSDNKEECNRFLEVLKKYA